MTLFEPSGGQVNDAESISDIESEIARVKPVIDAVRAQIGNVIVGQTDMVDRLLIGLLSNGHILLEGVPGLAKTTAVQALSDSLSLDFKRIQFTPDLLPSDLLGTQIYNPKEGSFSTHKGPLFTNIVLADEINRAPAKVQSALLEAMQERQITLDGTSHSLPESFMVLATQNPIEQEGTYPLPEAQADRFLLKVKIDYPTRDEEAEILRRKSGDTPVIESVASVEDLAACRAAVGRVRMERVVEDYIVDVVRATRSAADAGVIDVDRIIEVGASPRATLALAVTARAHAFLVAGRGYVTPDDVKAMAPDVLRHRVLLSYEAEADGISADDAIAKVLEQVRTP
jgi:MoxR-like ATPase